jgi:hypothetical protein
VEDDGLLSCGFCLLPPKENLKVLFWVWWSSSSSSFHPPSFLNWRFWILVAKCLDKCLEQILRTFLSLWYSKHNFFSWYAPPSTWQCKTTFFKETQALKLSNFQHPNSIILNVYSFSLFIKKSKEDKMQIESLFLIVRILNWH